MRRRSLGLCAAVAGALWSTSPVPRADAQPLAQTNQLTLHLADVAVQQWGVEQGLPQGSVTELAVDRNGHVWGATFGGLVRFDGRRIESYARRRVPVMVGNSVSALLADRDGSVWFGTPRGTIGRMRDGRYVDTLPSLPIGVEPVVDELLRDVDGSLVARIGSTVMRFKAGRWQDIPGVTPPSSPLTQAPDGSIWLATAAGVGRLTPTGVEVPAPSAQSRRDLRVHVDGSGRVWVGSRDGLTVTANGVTRSVGGIDQPVAVIATEPRDGGDVVWVGAGHDLYRLRLAPSTAGGALPTPERVLTSGAVPVSIAFADGVTIVGTAGGGLFTVRSTATRVLRVFSRGTTVDAAVVVGDGAGHAWVAPGCGDAFLYTVAGEVIDRVLLRRSQGCVRSLAFDGQRRLWVGYDGGVLRRDAQGRRREWTFDEPDRTSTRSLLEVGGRILVGLSDGRIGEVGADDRWRYLRGWDTVTRRPIESMTAEFDGALWVGQAGAITYVTADRRTVFTERDRIPSSVARVLHPDRRGGVWIGTYGDGLSHFRPGQGSRTVPLPDETVSGFVVDRRGGVWMPGNRGLTVLSIGQLTEWVRDSTTVPDVQLLTLADGVPEGNVGAPAGAVMDSQHVAFGSVEGLVIADIGRLPLPSSAAVVLIDRLFASRRVMDDPRDIRLGPTERTVDVEYSMPVYRAAEAVQFRYRLDGRDTDWIPLGSARRLQLAALPAGRLTLRLQGRAPGAAWRDAAPLPIEVTPMWHERTALRAGGTAVLALVLLLLIRQQIQTRAVRSTAMQASATAQREAAELSVRHQRELAQVGRVAIAGELTASLSHELGQPLAAIVNNAEAARRMLARREGMTASPPGAGEYPSDDLSDVPSLHDEVDDVLHDVVIQGRRASQVVREIRRFVRHGETEREWVPVPELFAGVVRLVRHEFADAEVTLQCRTDPRTGSLWVERVLLQQVLVNLLQNALEATKGQPVRRVLMRARPSRGGTRLSVVDNGAGFSADVLPRAFDPFITTRTAGMGMGLAITRRLVEAHGGHVSIGKLPTGGAVVSCWFPAVTDITSIVSRGASHV